MMSNTQKYIHETNCTIYQYLLPIDIVIQYNFA